MVMKNSEENIRSVIYYALNNRKGLNERNILGIQERFLKDSLDRKAVRYLKALYEKDEGSFYIICERCIKTIRFIEQNLNT